MLAFIFPGQGSQQPGMGRPWVDHPSWEIVKEASKWSGRDLERLILHADADELTQTRNAQLATFAVSLIALDAVERLGIEPAAAAGHSLGEYTALVAAGALSFEEGCRVVVERSEAMQQAAEDQPGSMYAVLGLDDEDVDVACRRADGDVWVANYNAPGQVVIAGSSDALDRAAAIARQLGAKRVVPLPVGGAFHTPYMASARARLRKALEESTFRDPEIPLVANVDGLMHESAGDWEGLCSAQLCSPVRWRQTLLRLSDLGVTALVELGPGSILTNLAGRVVPHLRTHSVSGPVDLSTLVEVLAAETPLAAYRTEHQGEQLFVHERLIVSTSTGLFSPLDQSVAPEIDQPIEVGTLVGRVGDQEVRTPFAGRFMGQLVIPGERVTVGQPVAWLRMQDNSK